MKNDSLVGVIINAYNSQAYLADTIESVLAQTWKNFELIVVDDGSTDNTGNIARSYGDKLIYHYQTNQRLGAARNAGIALARGDVVTFLDGDDLWHPLKLEKQLETLLLYPDVSMVFTMIEQFISSELDEERKKRIKGDGQVMAGYCASTLMIRKEALLHAGNFPTHIEIGEFLDWYGRAKDKGCKSLLIKDVLARRRIHGNNMGIQLKHQRYEYLHVVKAMLDRRRKV
ncbi:MAG: glycosyltransferase family A protein [Parachlamydiaceae bacterium]